MYQVTEERSSKHENKDMAAFHLKFDDEIELGWADALRQSTSMISFLLLLLFKVHI